MSFPRSLIALVSLVTLLAAWTPAQQASPSSPSTGVLTGTFEIHKRNGAPIVPQGTRILFLYGPASGCVVLGHVRAALDCHIEYAADRFLDEEFSCERRLYKPMQRIRNELSQMRSPATDADEQRREKLAGQLNSYYTRCGDRATTKVMAWVHKHPLDGWQVRSVIATTSGQWSAKGLRPGHYITVTRAHFSDIEIYSLNTDPPSVEAGKTKSVPTLEPLLSEHAQKF